MLKQAFDHVRYFHLRRCPLSRQERAELRGLFCEIDQQTDKVITLLDRNGYTAMDIHRTLLGLTNNTPVPEGKKKRINGGTLVPVKVNDFDRTPLPILADGMMRFLTGDYKRRPDTSGQQECMHSAMNEVALYKALVLTAEHALQETARQAEDSGIPRTWQQRQQDGQDRAALNALHVGVERLHEHVIAALGPQEPAALAQWETGMDNRIRVYRSLLYWHRQGRGHGQPIGPAPEVSAPALTTTIHTERLAGQRAVDEGAVVRG